MSKKICPQCNTEYPPEQLFCPKDGSTLKSLGGAADLVGSIIQKVYHVTKKLGEGGMGTVYLAEHVKMGRKAALKVMNPGMVNDADAISRFNREAANASKINHPNVAAVYDFGETEDGIIFLAMEFIEGPSLTKVIEDAGSLPAARAAEITRQASEALSVAHDMGIVHRDLKPDNIMLAKGRENTDIVKVVDFGIAKAGHDEGQKVTKTGMIVGTPEYMSPEQLSGDKLDGRSDTYSLALVAFNMLTGKLPFPGATSQETMIARLTDQPKTLTEMKPTTPWSPDVQAVMDKALARDAAERYLTAAEFGRELARAVSMMPLTDEMTAAHTAILAPPVVAKTAAEPKARPVPSTRVGSATPAGAPTDAIPAPAPKSKTGLMVGGGLGLVAVTVVAVMLLKTGDAGPETFNKATGADTGAGNKPVAAQAPPVMVDMDAVLDSVGKLTDLMSGTPAGAAQALQRLGQLSPSTMTQDQQVRAGLLTAEANVNRQNDGAACTSVKEIEGKSKGTKYEKQVSTILKSACP